MPLLRPEVSRLLEAANLKKSSSESASKDIKELLDNAGLGLTDTLDHMRTLRDMSESESTKIRINSEVLKMHGVLKEDSIGTIPTINIVIGDITNPIDNPILLPRELHKQKVREESIQ